jgi:hypothetical protein
VVGENLSEMPQKHRNVSGAPIESASMHSSFHCRISLVSIVTTKQLQERDGVAL